MHVFNYNTPIYREYFSNFSNLQKNISPTERFLILDAVLKWYWGVQQSFKGVQHSSS